MLKKFKTLKISNIENINIKKECNKYFKIIYKKNNTFITYIDSILKKICYISSGQLKDYKNFEKRSSIAAEATLVKIIFLIKNKKWINKEDKIILFVKGFEKFKPEIIKIFKDNKINISKIINQNQVQFGGCRSKKKRRK